MMVDEFHELQIKWMFINEFYNEQQIKVIKTLSYF